MSGQPTAVVEVSAGHSTIVVPTKIARCVPSFRDRSYEERLKECGLTTLDTRRLSGDQIEVFKILHGQENIDPNICFKINIG